MTGPKILIAPDGSAAKSLTVGHGSNGITQLLEKSFKAYHWHNMDYKAELERRDVMDLPDYYHRWEILGLEKIHPFEAVCTRLN